MKKRVGIFGGTFDPVHSGHVQAVHSFLLSGLIDEIWVLLSPDPPHKKRENNVPSYEHRLNMLQIAFRDIENVTISTLERELPTPSYTLRTLLHLKEAYPEILFFLCVGEDSVASFHTWHKYREILNECTLLAVKRPGADRKNAKEEVLEKTIFVDHQPIKISSTGIRKGKMESAEPLPDKVADYIDQHELYD